MIKTILLNLIKELADLNKDGKLDIKDLALLGKIITTWLGSIFGKVASGEKVDVNESLENLSNEINNI
jgi:hypothetical protein